MRFHPRCSEQGSGVWCMDNLAGVPVLVEEAPEIEYRNGLFHVIQRIGERRFERVMRPHIFLLGLRRAAEAARKHRFAGAEIIPFPKRSPQHG